MSVFLLLLSTLAVDARVTFDKSEVIDNVDLQGNIMTPFRCSAGCRIFSPTKSDQIIIVDANGNQMNSLRQLADLDPRVGRVELPGGSYQLRNMGPANPSFVFYAVEKGAANYDTQVLYVNSPIGLKNINNYTFLSSSGSVGFLGFYGFSVVDPMPTVYAAGFDSIASCRPVFTARSVATLGYTSFAINSPIATIIFNKAGPGNYFYVTGESTASKMDEETSSVYASPGYVGCPVVGDSLYTLTPSMTRIDASATLSRSAGFNVSVNGDYSIANQADALALNVNSDTMKLYGKNSISKSYDDTKFNIKLAWGKNEGSKDSFAVQIDIETKNGPK